MKFRILFLTFLCLFNTSTYAQSTYNMPVVCAPSKVIFNDLSKEFKELPLMVGNTDEEGIMTIWMGKSKSYTITITTNDITCIINYGSKLQVIRLDRD